jgi:hypothetical protein
MIKKLQEVAKWQAADSTTAIPALHYIAVTAQGAPGRDMYRMRMRSNKSIQYLSGQNHRCFGVLDIQVAHSTVKTENRTGKIPFLKFI